MKKIIFSLAIIAAVGAIAIGATRAYFSDTETSTGNTFTAGTLSINLYNQNTTAALQFSLTNWAPGDETLVNFDVLNAGSLPINIRGFAAGVWNTNPVNSDKVKVTKVERWDNGWVTLAADSGGITGWLYYSPNGQNANLYTIDAGQKAQLQLTVVFDSTAGNEYQGKIFNASITTEAKQVNGTWTD